LFSKIKSPQVRIVVNVAMICETIINEPPLNPKDIKRENIQCKLTYVAFGKTKRFFFKQEIIVFRSISVNPGGWVPSAGVRR